MGRIGSSFRLLRAWWILSREGVVRALPGAELAGGAKLLYRLSCWLAKKQNQHQQALNNISRAVHRLGPSYVKLGQFLATRPDIVGQEMAKDLAQLEDQAPQFSQACAIEQIENSLRKKINDIFVEFHPPIAAASMAQVHPATIRSEDGTLEKVAVKIIRPGVRERFIRDLGDFAFAAQLQEYFFPSSRRLRPTEIVKNLHQITKLELDLRLEAAAISEMAQNTEDDKDFRVPKVDWQRSGRSLLTMEWIDGIKISDKEKLEKAGYDLPRLATKLMRIFLRQALYYGFFHADMHPGNLFIDKKGRIVAVDFGITGRLGAKEQYFLAEILYGFIKRDYQRVAAAHFAAGYVPPFHNVSHFAQANRAIGEPIHGHNAQSISMAKLLNLLFEITELFDMQTRPELLLLQKTMVVVEGVARQLDPRFNMWEAASPVIRNWMQQNMGAKGLAKEMRNAQYALHAFMRKIPDYLIAVDAMLQHGHKVAQEGLFFADTTLERLAQFQQTKRRRSYVLWIVLACVISITIKFCLQ